MSKNLHPLLTVGSNFISASVSEIILSVLPTKKMFPGREPSTIFFGSCFCQISTTYEQAGLQAVSILQIFYGFQYTSMYVHIIPSRTTTHMQIPIYRERIRCKPTLPCKPCKLQTIGSTSGVGLQLIPFPSMYVYVYIYIYYINATFLHLIFN